MAAFRPEALVEKLNKLNASQQSIETISQWCIFFRKDAKKVVETWSSEFGRSGDLKKQLAMVYLANDILQNSRTKGAQFVVEFYTKLPPAVEHLFKHGDAKMQGSLTRMIKVWEERRVFGSSGVKPFMDLVNQSKTPARGQRNVVLQAMDPTVERLASASQEADQAHQRSAALGSKAAEVVCQDLSSSSADDLAAGLKILQQHSVALQNELGHRERVLSILQHLTSQQEEGKQGAERSLEGCQQMMDRHQHLLQDLQSRDQETAPWQDGGGGMAPEVSQPPPPPSNGLHPSPGAPPSYPSSSGAPPVETDPVSRLLGGMSQGANGSAAADLVAQLSQSGASAQMLLDAISALPLTGAGGQASSQEEEYDPELGM